MTEQEMKDKIELLEKLVAAQQEVIELQKKLHQPAQRQFTIQDVQVPYIPSYPTPQWQGPWIVTCDSTGGNASGYVTNNTSHITEKFNRCQ